MKAIPKTLTNRPFTAKEAKSLGLSAYYLNRYVSDGSIEQVSRGVYRLASLDLSEEDLFKIATAKVGRPSAICLISALSLYHLTDAIPKKTWISVSHEKRSSDRSLKVLRLRNPNWKIGIELHDGYSVTSMERTIVECFMYRRIVSTTIAINALKVALKTKKTTLGKVTDMAKKLNYLSYIVPYIEALS